MTARQIYDFLRERYLALGGNMPDASELNGKYIDVWIELAERIHRDYSETLRQQDSRIQALNQECSSLKALLSRKKSAPELRDPRELMKENKRLRRRIADLEAVRLAEAWQPKSGLSPEDVLRDATGGDTYPFELVGALLTRAGLELNEPIPPRCAPTKRKKPV